MLNMQKIFEAQEKLDRKVVEVHGLQGKSLTGDVTQALYTELGELSNEIGFFKYWKKNKRNDKARQHDEWADCMHFMASLGNKYGHVDYVIEDLETAIFTDVDYKTDYRILFNVIYKADFSYCDEYGSALSNLIIIGLKLGMTIEDMEKAYFEKNQVNYDRLASGY
ncbi:dUTP diphosphatase [Bacillus luti]|uniref:dUTP diphosphatase n=1 Tax=Bacillus luti TaxID=2026191 RepID=UPI0028A09B6F|nr:dUTP diphosphatase [Bacillus luti]